MHDEKTMVEVEQANWLFPMQEAPLLLPTSKAG